MKVYVIKYKMWEDIDGGLTGSGPECFEGYLSEIYVSKEIAEKHKPKNTIGCWSGTEYTIVEKDVINK